MGGRGAITVGLVGAMLAAVPASTPAVAAPASVQSGRYVEVIGPRLAGGRVVWGQRRSDRGLDLRAAPLPGLSSPVTLATRRPVSASSSDYQGFLAASDSVVLMRNAELTSGGRYEPGSVVDFGTLGVFGTQVAQVAPACEPARDCRPFVLDVDGSRAISSGPRLDTVTLTDFATGSAREVAAPGAIVRIAGRYLAWVVDGHAVVYDHVADRELYRVPGASRGITLDVQPDGKVLFGVEETGARQALAWASPQEPVAHRLPVPPALTTTALLAGDRVVFAREASAGDSELGIVGLRDRQAQVLVRPAATPDLRIDRGFDFDGGRLAWAERTCSGERIATATVTELRARPHLRTLRCPLRLTRPIRVRNGRVKSFAVWYSCAGFHRECYSGQLLVRAARSYRVGKRRVRRGATLARHAYINGAPGTHVRLTRVGRRLLLARSRVRVRVIAEPFDGAPGGGFRQRRTVLTTIRAQR